MYNGYAVSLTFSDGGPPGRMARSTSLQLPSRTLPPPATISFMILSVPGPVEQSNSPSMRIYGKSHAKCYSLVFLSSDGYVDCRMKTVVTDMLRRRHTNCYHTF